MGDKGKVERKQEEERERRKRKKKEEAGAIRIPGSGRKEPKYLRKTSPNRQMCSCNSVCRYANRCLPRGQPYEEGAGGESGGVE